MAWPWDRLLGPVLAGIFMVELETLGRPLLKWKRYADDTFCYVKIGTVNVTKIN